MYVGPDNHGEVDALVLTIARHGSTLQVGTFIVIMELACRAYEFTISTRLPLAPRVLMTRTGDVLYGGAFDAIKVRDTRTASGAYDVHAEAASRIAATRDRHGQCLACATYSHHLCLSRQERGFCKSGPRGCACQGPDACHCNDGCRTPYAVSGAALGWSADQPAPDSPSGPEAGIHPDDGQR